MLERLQTGILFGDYKYGTVRGRRRPGDHDLWNFFRMFRPTVYVLRRNILIRSHSLEIFYGLIDTQCMDSKRKQRRFTGCEITLRSKMKTRAFSGSDPIFSPHIVVIRGNRGCGSELAVEHHIGLC